MPDEMGRDGGVVTYLLLFLLITVSNTTPQFLHRYIVIHNTSTFPFPLFNALKLGHLFAKILMD